MGPWSDVQALLSCDLWARKSFISAITVPESVLQRGADAIHLAPKAFDVLVALLRHPTRLVSKDELLARVWH